MARKKQSEKQIHILDVAEKLIAEKGFEGTSVRAISSAAQVNVAMISYYFGSKEKMMAHLYEYRIRKTRENFAGFAETIKEGKPEMQMKELIRFVVAELFRFSFFHGFVSQELRQHDVLKKELTDFYMIFCAKLEEVIKKGVASGVFRNAPKAEDVLSIVTGTTLFVIRNRNFYELYIHGRADKYQDEAQQKNLSNILIAVFALLGYHS